MSFNIETDDLVGSEFVAPAAFTSFAGTISAAARTATFTETGDYNLCKVGSILIADGDTRVVVALLGSDQVTVDADTTWAGATAITSLQDPISQHIDSSGNVDMYVNALGGIGLIGGAGSLQKGISFGDGDSGMYETADDDVTVIADNIEIGKNDSWVSGLNYAGDAGVNMFKVNVDDEIGVGGTLVLGAGLEAAEDAGAVTRMDMPVSATPAAGVEMSFTDKIDGTNILKVYAEADSGGGIQNPSVRPNAPIIQDQAPQVLSGAGAVDITSAITHVVTDAANALTLVDGAEGQHKYIVMKTDLGAGTLTPTNLGNGSTITFDDVGDSVDLLFTNAAWHFMGGTATLA